MEKVPPPLAGQEVYFDGSIVADLKLGAGVRPTEGTPGSGMGGGGGSGGGGSGRGRRGGGGYSGGGGMGGGGRRGGGQGAGETEGETGGGMRPAGLRPGGGPPGMIHIQVTNKGPAPVVVSATDFNSPLGNFVVLPEKLTLEPAQSAEFDPMPSRLGGASSEGKMTLTFTTAPPPHNHTLTLPPEPPAPPPPP